MILNWGVKCSSFVPSSLLTVPFNESSQAEGVKAYTDFHFIHIHIISSSKDQSNVNTNVYVLTLYLKHRYPYWS